MAATTGFDNKSKLLVQDGTNLPTVSPSDDELDELGNMLIGKEDLTEFVREALGEHATAEVIEQVLANIMEGEGDEILYEDF